MSRQTGWLWKHKLKIVLGLIWLTLFFAGLLNFAGSRLVYTLFSITSLAMLLSGVYRQVSYGYLFLVIFLWLGFWFKLTANFLLFGFFPFGEPVGSFNSSAHAWNQVLWIAIAGNMGAMLGRFLYGLFRPMPSADTAEAKVPSWYPSIRRWLWTAILLTTAVLAFFNIVYGIHQIGTVPRTILHWPLNALIAWMLNIGSALVIAVLIWWDSAAKKNVMLPLYAMLGEAFLSTVSVISRSAFPFHAIPPILALIGRRETSQMYSRKQVLFLLATFAVLFLASIAAVSFLRDYQYAASKAIPTPTPISAVTPTTATSEPIPAEALAPPTKAISSFRLILIHQLLVNRWIGLEGVMAVSSYEEKSSALLWQMLTEIREAGKVTAYQKISNSGYQTADGKYQFASMPGISGFLYYSGSLWLVIGGLAAFTTFTIASERIIFLLTRNPLLCSLYGMTLANTIAHFGMTPRQDIPQYLMMYVAILAIWFVQSRFFPSPFAEPVN
ncbi:hypothetical protein [Polaromonas sp.]|jgi:hypothetical protein|uniref:hypothetical protein n=1 Tax=Polaromonas sp. TaxID=1869339 RepID=UPI0037C5352C